MHFWINFIICFFNHFVRAGITLKQWILEQNDFKQTVTLSLKKAFNYQVTSSPTCNKQLSA